jgi:methylthioribose-1-phosphate isomerase
LDPDEKLKAVDRIHTQIMIQNKLLENLNKSRPTQINIINVTVKVLNLVKEWEKQGIIEIKSPEKFKQLEEIYKKK